MILAKSKSRRSVRYESIQPCLLPSARAAAAAILCHATQQEPHARTYGATVTDHKTQAAATCEYPAGAAASRVRESEPPVCGAQQPPGGHAPNSMCHADSGAHNEKCRIAN
ncbi:hypothetical protein AVEN_38099-1 [Araneus ventricosus]|uniref:Uncharacterized protein n=1 Tax=Araneus ventricosus TaxID=182803 RepID=A0A4Y2G961_ARAVE|nr:hypothetical protein AVEN_38099-1 [Araneus ventricosus]